MLLDSQHKNNEDELRRQKHLNKESLCFVCAASEEGVDGHRAWEEGLHHAGRGHASEELGGDDKGCPENGEAAAENQREGDL